MEEEGGSWCTILSFSYIEVGARKCGVHQDVKTLLPFSFEFASVFLVRISLPVSSCLLLLSCSSTHRSFASLISPLSVSLFAYSLSPSPRFVTCTLAPSHSDWTAWTTEDCLSRDGERDGWARHTHPPALAVHYSCSLNVLTLCATSTPRVCSTQKALSAVPGKTHVAASHMLRCRIYDLGRVPTWADIGACGGIFLHERAFALFVVLAAKARKNKHAMVTVVKFLREISIPC